MNLFNVLQLSLLLCISKIYIVYKFFLFNQFEDPRNKFEGEEFSEDALKSWVFVQSMPTIVEFSHETASKIFGGQIKYHLLLFLSKVRLNYYLFDFTIKMSSN